MTDVSPEIIEALNTLDERKHKLLELERPLAVVGVLRKKFPEMSFSPPMVAAFERTDWADVQVFGMCATVHDLQPVFEFLGKEGYRQTRKPRDVPELSARAWFFGQIMILVMLGLGSSRDKDGKKCHYVEVGKKEVPIYELKCD